MSEMPPSSHEGSISGSSCIVFVGEDRADLGAFGVIIVEADCEVDCVDWAKRVFEAQSSEIGSAQRSERFERKGEIVRAGRRGIIGEFERHEHFA